MTQINSIITQWMMRNLSKLLRSKNLQNMLPVVIQTQAHRDERSSGAPEPQPIMLGHRLAQVMAENVVFWRFPACASATYACPPDGGGCHARPR